MNSSTTNFHDFWEDYFPKSKLLLAANALIYLNISIAVSKIYGPSPLARHGFLHRTTTFGVKIRPVLKNS